VSVKRLLLVNIIVILIIIVGGFAAYYFYNQSTLYLKTDDAAVSGQEIVVAAPTTGKLVSWNGDTGSDFSSGDTVGQIAAGGTKPIDVTMPQSATVVQNQAVENEIVAAGTPLAYAYNLQNLWVMANVKETEISDVKVGQDVDVYVDAFPGITLKGTVKQIGLATASTFSLLPSSNDTANYTKVTQVIPVQIKLEGDEGIGLTPGMSASVRIHK
jgi:multidrug resistance efflux pump